MGQHQKSIRLYTSFKQAKSGPKPPRIYVTDRSLFKANPRKAKGPMLILLKKKSPVAPWPDAYQRLLTALYLQRTDPGFAKAAKWRVA